MSASSQKRKRQETLSSGPELDSKKKKSMNKGLKWTLGIICTVLIVVVVGFFAILGAGRFEKSATAVTVGSHKVTPATFNYFFKDVYNRVASQYGDYIDLIIDPDTPLSEQPYSEEQSWADALTEQAITLMTQTYAIYDAAIADGFTLDEAQQESVNSSVSMMETYASIYGQTPTGFLVANYGKGCTIENYREYVELTQIVSAYSTAYTEKLEYSAEELQSYYETNAATFDTVSFRYFRVAIESGEVDEEGVAIIDEAASEARAKELAELAAGDVNAFVTLAYENAGESSKSYYEDVDATLSPDQSKETVTSSMPTLVDWLFDASRAYGDTTYAQASSSGYYVAFYVDNSEKFDVNMVDVRHILIAPETDAETGESTPEAWDAASAKAEEVLAQYLAGEQTEDAFAALAAENSTDGNASSGGLYEDVYPGQMVTTFNDWCFDASRKYGDTAIVQTSYGYHVMYFVNADGENYNQYRLTEAKRSEDMNTWVEGLSADYTATQHSFGMFFVSY